MSVKTLILFLLLLHRNPRGIWSSKNNIFVELRHYITINIISQNISLILELRRTIMTGY